MLRTGEPLFRQPELLQRSKNGQSRDSSSALQRGQDAHVFGRRVSPNQQMDLALAQRAVPDRGVGPDRFPPQRFETFCRRTQYAGYSWTLRSQHMRTQIWTTAALAPALTAAQGRSRANNEHTNHHADEDPDGKNVTIIRE
jgi:hypothetical protein